MKNPDTSNLTDDHIKILYPGALESFIQASIAARDKTRFFMERGDLYADVSDGTYEYYWSHEDKEWFDA